jgi:hypothetical protein
LLEELQSAVDGSLNHLIFQRETSPETGFTRTELISPNNFLQAAYLEIPGDFSFRAHAHLSRARNFPDLIAQESWVVLDGEVEVTYFDLDDTLMGIRTLRSGDATITLRGGHSYRTLGGKASVFEFKSGPYEGVEIDKRFI